MGVAGVSDRSNQGRSRQRPAMTASRQLDPDLRDATGDLVLERATGADSEFAFAMRKAAFQVYVDKCGGWDDRKERLRHARNFALYDYRLIRYQGANCGIMSLDLTTDRLKLNQIFIAPRHQGHGIGERCMSVLFAEARRLGVPIQLRVMKVNPRAAALYTRLGFSVVPPPSFHRYRWLHPADCVRIKNQPNHHERVYPVDAALLSTAALFQLLRNFSQQHISSPEPYAVHLQRDWP